MEQNDDFYNVPADFIQGDVTNVEFLDEIIRLGMTEVDGIITFDSDLIFLDEQYWMAPGAGMGGAPRDFCALSNNPDVDGRIIGLAPGRVGVDLCI